MKLDLFVRMSREGSLEAPTRHPIDWRNEEFYDPAKLDAEMRRVFEICHGCRRCFNLCDSFPRLFELIDNNPAEDVEGVATEDFSKVTEACTLCDMCFMTKCPYVPPHPWQVDFPHLLLRHRMVEARDNKTSFTARQLAEMDRNGMLMRGLAPLANWASDKHNRLTRPLMEKTLGIDAHAELPKFVSRTFVASDHRTPISPNASAPAFGQRKAALFATCFVNYNKPSTGMAARAVLNHLGVETRAAYPGCCGMPFLEQADLKRVATQAEKISKELCTLIDAGYDIVTLTASCGLMLKFEWKLILPENEHVQRLAKAVFDIDEYIVDISKRHGLPEGLKALPEGERVLPQAGLIFFTYRGKAEGIKSLELIYEGAAGKVTIPPRTPNILAPPAMCARNHTIHRCVPTGNLGECLIHHPIKSDSGNRLDCIG
jgi:glycerol-3-phosphate dehydrogenase subunit C